MTSRLDHLPALARALGRLLIAGPAAAMLVVFALAQRIFPADPREPVSAPFIAPNQSHPLGTDDLGRDMLAAMVHGGQASLMSGAVVMIGAAALGIGLGVAAGMAGPDADRLIVRLMDLSQIVPRFFLALLVSAWIGVGWIPLAVILALTGWAPLARLVRAETRSMRKAGFVEAAMLLGSSRMSIAARHLVPNVLPFVWPQMPLIFASALLIEAGLCFLGAGDPSRLSWGSLIQIGQVHAMRAWWLAVCPGLGLALASVGLMLLAMRLGSEKPDAWQSKSPAAKLRS